MKIVDNKRLMFIALGALIITLVVNFPNIIDVFTSDTDKFSHFNKFEGGPPPFRRQAGPIPDDFNLPDQPLWTKEAFQVFQFLWYFMLGFALLVNTTKTEVNHEKHPQLITCLKVLATVTFLYLGESLIIRQLAHHRMIGFRHGIDAVLLGRYLFADRKSVV